MKKPLLLATTNTGKIKEFQNLITKSKLNIQLLTLKDFSNIIDDIDENAPDFLGNALLKARGYFEQAKIPIITDDSGLVIPALNGEPGVRSARYAGEHVDFQKNINLVLKKLESITQRNAYFVSCVVFLENMNLFTVSEGFCYGSITIQPSGNNGFGYDPIFFLEQYNSTMADITLEEKQKISHRYQAFKQILPYLTNYASQ